MAVLLEHPSQQQDVRTALLQQNCSKGPKQDNVIVASDPTKVGPTL